MGDGSHFRQCWNCLKLAKLSGQELACPFALKKPITEADYGDLICHTPFVQWRTPAQIGQEFGYSPKHVIRLATTHKTKIAAYLVDGRWFVLACSFALYLDENS